MEGKYGSSRLCPFCMPCGQCWQYLYRDRFDRNEENPSIGLATMALRLPDCRPFVIICIRSSHGFSDLPPSPIRSSSLHFAMASGSCSEDPGLADQRDQTMSAAADRPPTSQPSGSQDRSLVFIVDDDLRLGDALSSLLRSVGHNVEVFSSASDMLKSKLPDLVRCIVLDIRMPALRVPALQSGLS